MFLIPTRCFVANSVTLFRYKGNDFSFNYYFPFFAATITVILNNYYNFYKNIVVVYL